METPVPVPATPGWRRYLPWQGRATGTDKALLGAILAVIAFGLVLRPLTPFLIASHPVLLAFLTGDLTAIGAAAAFARIGAAPFALVVLAGAIGMSKFDWLTWWIGRRWGSGILGMLTASGRAQRMALRVTELNPWILRVAVVVAGLPGLPTALLYAAAGSAGMRLRTFILLDLLGTLLMTGLVSGLGYALGHHAVDVVLLIDEYAAAVSLTLLAAALLLPLIKRWRRTSSTRASRRSPRRRCPT